MMCDESERDPYSKVLINTRQKRVWTDLTINTRSTAEKGVPRPLRLLYRNPICPLTEYNYTPRTPRNHTTLPEQNRDAVKIDDIQ